MAIEKIGSSKEFGVLYKTMAEFDRGLCVRVMRNIVGDDFDKAVVDALKRKDGANMASLAKSSAGATSSRKSRRSSPLLRKTTAPRAWRS